MLTAQQLCVQDILLLVPDFLSVSPPCICCHKDRRVFVVFCAGKHSKTLHIQPGRLLKFNKCRLWLRKLSTDRACVLMAFAQPFLPFKTRTSLNFNYAQPYLDIQKFVLTIGERESVWFGLRKHPSEASVEVISRSY